MRSPYFKLKVCMEYLNGATHKDIQAKYNISRHTIYKYLRIFDKDFLASIEFYRYIMVELVANGYKDAAKYLHDNGVDVLSSFFGGDLNKFDFEFDAALNSFGPVDLDGENDGNDDEEAQISDETRRKLNAFSLYQPDRERD